MEMTSREIITRVIEHRDAPRIGFDFINPHANDFCGAAMSVFKNAYEKYAEWGTYPEILAKVPGFQGEVRIDHVGNILGRFNGKTKGECIRGALDSWDDLDNFAFPEFDERHTEWLMKNPFHNHDKYVIGYAPVAIFSTLRDTRLMTNALMDTVLEPENVEIFLSKIQDVLIRSVEIGHKAGMDALMMADDWGMQHAPFISPVKFRELFKPIYKAVADALHERNMKFILHSCGLVWDYIPDMLDAGIDVFQFDQPELSGSENLARTFGKRMTLYAPVDIQKVMATGNRELIEATASNMIRVFREFADGALIAKDYPTWWDIDVDLEWADWARNVFLKECWNK